MELPWTPIYSRPADGLQHDGYCNEFYPNGPTTYARFIWAVRMLTRNGFVVLIDNHLNSDPTVTQNPAQWLQASSVKLAMFSAQTCRLFRAAQVMPASW